MKKMLKISTAAMALTMLAATAMPVFAVDPAVEPEVMTAVVTLNGDSAVAEGEHVTIEGTKITVNASGSYEFTGTLNDGQICVNVPDELADPETVKLFFNGVCITGVSEAAVYIVNAENTSINLVKDTQNYLYDGEIYTETDAVICSKDDMTIKGEGSLRVEAATQYGISCNNDLKITGGNLKVKTLLADGIRAKTSVEIKGGVVDVNAEGDGIKSTKGDVFISGGTIEAKAGNDAVQGETSIQITDGTLLANGDRGLRCDAGTIDVMGGTMLVTATDYQAVNLNVVQPAILLNFSAESVKDLPFSLYEADSELPVYEMTPDKKFSYAMISAPLLKVGSTYRLEVGNAPVEGAEAILLSENATNIEGAVVTAKDPLRYDIDDDGVNSISDAILLARFTSEDMTVVLTDKGKARIDCNGDGQTNAEDLVQMLRFLAKLGD